MFFTPSQTNFLTGNSGTEWLNRAALLPLTPTSMLSDLHLLRTALSADQAAAVVEQTLLQRRGSEKFSLARQMLFTRDALEQSTRETITAYRAQRFAGFETVVDLGCGIGGDTLALAQTVPHVLAIDLDSVRLTFAQHNARVYNLAAKIAFIRTDALHLPVTLGRVEAMFADPSRRSLAGKRTFNPQEYTPPLDKLMMTYPSVPLAIKVAPGIDFSYIPPGTEVEIISFAGEVKEAVLWANSLANSAVLRQATLLPGKYSLTNTMPADCPLAPLTDYLYEPDPAIIRAGLVEQAGCQLGLHRIDEQIAYLSGKAIAPSPLVTAYHIEARLPLQIKQINHYLQTHSIHRLNIKQRGTGLQPDSVAKKLKPASHGEERTLILLRAGNSHLALIARQLSSDTR